MSDWFSERYPPTRPRRVEGGLKARTARGAIGSTWWSRRFLEVLESLAMGGRLDRGRNYARRGQVISLEVVPGAVNATVQGSRARPYEVSIGLPVFPEDVWVGAEVALAEQALPSAKLLAGEVPPELEEIFAAAGAPLFPRTARELEQRCSCPDAAVPCKHLAATFYLMAEAFDEDPFLILRWRGRDRKALLDRVRQLRSGGGPTETTAVTPSSPAGAALALIGLMEPGDRTAHFWQPPPPLPARPPVLEVEPDLLIRQLPAPDAALGGPALAGRLQEAYRRLGTPLD
jgi:uncharacterized Zn finger protein